MALGTKDGVVAQYRKIAVLKAQNICVNTWPSSNHVDNVLIALR